MQQTKVYCYSLAGQKINVTSTKPNHPGFRIIPGEPTDIDGVLAQMQAGLRYRNALCQLDLERRNKRAAIWAKYEWLEIDQIKANKAELSDRKKQIRADIKARNKAARSKVGQGTDIEKAELKTIDAELKTLTEQLKTLIASKPKVDWEQIKVLTKQIKDNKDSKALVANLESQILALRLVDPSQADLIALEDWAATERRAICGVARGGTWQPLPWETTAPTTKLYFGTYQSVDESYQLMRGGKDAPKFRGWRGEGKVAYHWQNDGVQTWSELKQGKDNKLILKYTGEKNIWSARLWYQSNGKGIPVYTEFRFYLDREPEPDALIKWAYLVRYQDRQKYRWELQLVVTQPDRLERGSGTVAINLGWTLLNDSSVRCLYAVDDQGRPVNIAGLIDQGQAVIPADMVGLATEYRGLDAVRTDKLNLLRQSVVNWLGTAALPPEQLALFGARQEDKTPIASNQQLVAALTLWTSKGRWLGLIDRLLPQGQPPILPLPAVLVAELIDYRRWSGEPHLAAWQANSRRSYQAWRLDTYRRIAAALRARFGTVLIDGTVYAKIAKRKEPEQDKQHGAKANKDIVSPFILREVITQALPTTKVDPEHITQQCHVCQHIEPIDPASITVACSQCNLTCDRDYRACRNLLARGGVVVDTPLNARIA